MTIFFKINFTIYMTKVHKFDFLIYCTFNKLFCTFFLCWQIFPSLCTIDPFDTPRLLTRVICRCFSLREQSQT